MPAGPLLGPGLGVPEDRVQGPGLCSSQNLHRDSSTEEETGAQSGLLPHGLISVAAIEPDQASAQGTVAGSRKATATVTHGQTGHCVPSQKVWLSRQHNCRRLSLA